MRVIDCFDKAQPETFVRSAQAHPLNLAREHQIVIWINERPAVNVTCTPEHLDELAVGRLLTEGLVSTAGEILLLEICEDGRRARVTVRPDADALLDDAITHHVDTSCSDRQMLASSKKAAMKPVQPIEWQSDWIRSLAERLNQTDQPLYTATHAAHACFLSRRDLFLIAREDIGRHNALDKVVGWAAIHGVDLSQCLMFTTGRMPADMVRKAIRCGVPVLASKTYPTEQGAALARDAGLTLMTVRPNGTLLTWSD